MNYLQITIPDTSPELNEILIAHLEAYPFNGFEEGESQLTAYIGVSDYSEQVAQVLQDTAQEHQLSYTTEELQEKNWNAQWESDYQPVLVEDFCAVRATFHAPITSVQYEIVITPKMSFGTGHHATTYMMMKQMQGLDFAQKSVLDYGCGTGVLAILAQMLQATTIDAVDIEDWAYANTVENVAINSDEAVIKAYCGTIETVPKRSYEIILANINRNVLLDTMPDMAERLLKGGNLLLSGFLEQDIELVEKRAAEFGLQPQKLLKREQWRCLLLSKN